MFEKLNNLKIRQKLIVVASLLALPILVLLYLFVDSRDQLIARSNEELKGLEYVAALRPVLERIPQHRDTAIAILNGDDALREGLETIRKRIEVDMATVDVVDERLGKQLQVSGAWQSVKASWRQIQPQATSVPAKDSFVRHTALVSQLIDLMRTAGEQSKLATDQNLDAFYLADTLLHQTSWMTEDLGQLRRLSAPRLGPKRSATPVLRSLDPQSHRRFRDAEGFSNLRIRPASLLKVPRTQPTALFPTDSILRR